MAYIDNQKLLSLLDDAVNASGNETLSYLQMKRIIANAPVEDVEEVRYGDWQLDYDDDLWCTACKQYAPSNKRSPRCPNCGARMNKKG